MITRVIVDWLRYSFKGDGMLSSALPDWEVFADREHLDNPYRFYDHAVRHGSARVDTSRDMRAQGGLVTITGRDMEQIRAAGESEVSLLRHAMTIGSVTRIDIAVDVMRGGKTPFDIDDMIVSGQIDCSSKKRLKVSGSDGGKSTGQTLYLGSRKSERMLRIYDKGRQQKIDKDWLRIELEIKGRRAAATAKAACARGVACAGRAAIWSMLHGSNGWWQGVIWGDSVPEPDVVVPRKDTDSDVWLYTVALPAVCKALQAGKAGVADSINRDGFGIVP